jgi:hypothetical protein
MVTIYRFTMRDSGQEPRQSYRWGSREGIANYGGEVLEHTAIDAEPSALESDMPGLTVPGFNPHLALLKRRVGSHAGLLLFLLGVAILYFGTHQLEIISETFDQVCPPNDFGRSSCDVGRVPVQYLQGLVVLASVAIPVAIACILSIRGRAGT